MVKLYLDEHLSGFAQRLRSFGHDVVTGADEGRQGRTDAWHFRQALDEGRLILTWDRQDFEYLHRLWTALRTLGVVSGEHPGILTAAASREFVPAEWISVAEEKLSTEGPFEGRMWTWVASKRDWVPDSWHPED
jgi:hypothetical protein